MKAHASRQAIRRAARTASWALLLAIAAGCASTLRDGEQLIDEGRYEDGLAVLEQAVRDHPRDSRSRMRLAQQRQRVLAALFAQADHSRSARDFPAAAAAHARVLAIDPANGRAREALRQIEQTRHAGELLVQARAALRRDELDGATRLLRQVLELDPRDEAALALRREVEDRRVRSAAVFPQLRAKLSQPVSLEFRDGSVKQIFEALSRVAGINFLFDRDLKPDLRATLFVRDVPVEQAVELLLMQNQLQHKLLSDNTVLIYPDTPQKQREYQELTIRTFHLAHTDAKTAQSLVKTMLKAKDVFIDERLNTLTLRDTPDAIRLAEKLLLAQGQPEPEVVLEVEVLEISRQRILDLGLQWPNTFGVLRPDRGGAPGILDQLRGIDASRITLAPSPELRINAQDNDVNTLANPVIRVSNKEKARIHIGQRVPVVSATSTPSTQGPVITESIQYLEVGLKLEVEPTVHLDGEVAIRVGLEVSKATPLPATRNGTIPVQVDTRNAATSLRLKDGETQVLAGLVRNDHDVSGNRIPGLGDIPGLGRLFGSNKDTVGKSELLLSITPRIVRNLPYLSPHELEFPSGTDSLLRLRPGPLLAMAAGAGGSGSESGMSAASESGAGGAASAPLAATVGDAATAGAAQGGAMPNAVAATGQGAVADMAALGLSWRVPQQLAVGEEVEVVLQASATQALKAATLQLAYDPAALRIAAVTEGDLMNRDGAITSFAPRIDVARGRMFVALSRSAAGGARGEGALLRLRVAALRVQAQPVTLRVTSLSAIGEGNRPLPAALPPALELVAR